MAAEAQKPEDYGKIRVFVYGSLKRGQPNAQMMRRCGAQFIGMDTITGNYSLISLGAFPAIVRDNNETTIYGEVWAGDEVLLETLDCLEGHPNFYERQKVWTDEYESRVWTYILPEDWIDEAKDVVDYGCWNPSDRERDHWTGASFPVATDG